VAPLTRVAERTGVSIDTAVPKDLDLHLVLDNYATPNGSSTQDTRALAASAALPSR
jgi:hypothetical protein